ncbi:hypothetical protein EUTSA_v10002448mg [Eutrema salsugineum]|uniref:Uncharacterized protein n=1 Tax=Eutrema salsugineum TaxID=72664 RepID=V4LBY7_EUTSA|nr:hypothetical protein EUTSA_v10002448mg [Eutrema salsugineum]
MPESNQISRKRMRFSSSSASEILTTMKSQHQRDRSSRIAPIGNGFRVNQSPSLIGKIDSKIIRTYPRVTIKDLRLRRVFSPSSISIDSELKTNKGENLTKEQNDSNIVEEGTKVEAEEFLQTTPPDTELLSSGPFSMVNEAERICEEINGQAVKKSGAVLCSKSVLHSCTRAKIFKNPGSFSYKRLLPYLMQASDDVKSSSHCSKPEKSLIQNPPNVDFSCNKETVETKTAATEDPKEEVGELMTAKCPLPESTKQVSQSVDRVFDKHSAGSFCRNTSPLKKVLASSPNKKSGSVNYRRMLPYLRDIQEDYPYQKENSEETTPSSMSVSDNEGAEEKVTSDVARESDICSNEIEEPLPPDVSESPEMSDTDKEQETQVKHVIPDTEKNLGTPGNVLGSEVPLSSPLVGSTSSVEVATSALTNTVIDVGEVNISDVEETEAKDSAEQLEENSSNLTAEPLDPSVVSGTPPSISPSKGILKRSIRGCRGICSCLNCSSFRLNAERAFEFSRNQLQDTEVMVLDLIEEISRLRDVLEKYDSPDHNGSYKSQAGEATKRASEAAELAKSRLHQMNEDLQVHCRIPNEQRARVKFAHYVHEKTILKASEPNKFDP